MGKFREWLREAECKKNVNEETVKEETEYQKFFAKKLEKFGVSSPAELSVEDKKKFFNEIEAEWEGEKEEPESDDVNEAVSEQAKKFMKEFNAACSFLKEEVKDSEKNHNWKVRLEYIRNLIDKELKK